MKQPAIRYEGRCAICKGAFRRLLLGKRPKCPRRNQRQFMLPFTVSFGVLQAISSGLQNISSKTPRDPAAAAMVADAVRIIDNYIKVGLPHLLALALVQNHIRMHCHLLETEVLCCVSVRYFACVAICLPLFLPLFSSCSALAGFTQRAMHVW